MTRLRPAYANEIRAGTSYANSGGCAQYARHRFSSSRVSFRSGVCMALVAMLLSAGCATVTPSPPLESSDVATFAVPIVYTDGLGVGAGTVEGAIELAKGNEAKAASRAIVLALQEFETSVTDPTLTAGELLPQKRTWVSDRAPVPPSRIRDHNALHPEMKLPERYTYQMQFLGEYAVDRDELVFRISAKLYEAAAAAGPRAYTNPYSGKFFVDALGKLIQDKLRGHTLGNAQ